MKENGKQQADLLHKGKGRPIGRPLEKTEKRKELAKLAGTTEMAFKDRNEAIVWMLRNQLGRRNLNDFQRNEVALKFQNVIAQQMKERQVAGQKLGGKIRQKTACGPIGQQAEKTNQRKELAKIAGTSEGSIQRSKKILDEGTPEQIERARKGGKLIDN